MALINLVNSFSRNFLWSFLAVVIKPISSRSQQYQTSRSTCMDWFLLLDYGVSCLLCLMLRLVLLYIWNRYTYVVRRVQLGTYVYFELGNKSCIFYIRGHCWIGSSLELCLDLSCVWKLFRSMVSDVPFAIHRVSRTSEKSWNDWKTWLKLETSKEGLLESFMFASTQCNIKSMGW